MPGFWAGGHDAYRDGLYEEYSSRRSQLEREFDKADSVEGKRRLAKQVQELDDSYQTKRKSGRDSLF
jgi:hypothetical protein